MTLVQTSARVWLSWLLKRLFQEQIERFKRRIDYYHEKAARENTEEYPRVAELQQQILDLQNEMEQLTKGSTSKQPEEEKKARRDEKEKGD